MADGHDARDASLLDEQVASRAGGGGRRGERVCASAVRSVHGLRMHELNESGRRRREHRVAEHQRQRAVLGVRTRAGGSGAGGGRVLRVAEARRELPRRGRRALRVARAAARQRARTRARRCRHRRRALAIAASSECELLESLVALVLLEQRVTIADSSSASASANAFASPVAATLR